MILILDTTMGEIGRDIVHDYEDRGGSSVRYIHTGEMQISPCIGCNHCWLKTPGICALKDDYEPILKRIMEADQVWLISDTRFGFVTYPTKNLVDRVMPLVTMYLHFSRGEMRHVMRYGKKQTNWGVIYRGDGNRKHLERWCERVAVNFGSHSLGAYPEEERKEALACMC